MALHLFFDTPAFISLPLQEKELLSAQHTAMSRYLNILTSRSVDYPQSEPDITSLELEAAGKTGRRVTREEIEALLAAVTYKTVVPVGTTTTFVHAYLGNFYLDSGFSACVDPTNFIAATGERIARADAVAKATQVLWKLEGYALYKELNHG